MTREQASAELIGWLYMMMVDGVPIHSAKRKALIVALEALQDNHGTWKFIDHLWQCSNCGNRENVKAPPKYCSDCGSRMEAEEIDE